MLNSYRPVFTLQSLAGLQLYLDATQTPAGSVASWTDLSGNGNNATQGTSGARPVCTANTIGGKNALVFDGVNDLLTVSAFQNSVSLSSQFTALVVFKYSGSPPATLIGSSISASDRMSIQHDGGDSLCSATYNGSVFTASSAVMQDTATGHFVVMTNSTANAVQQYIDGVISAENSTPGTSATAAFNIGATAGGTDFFTGAIGLIAVWNRQLSATELTSINSFISQEFNIALPSSFVFTIDTRNTSSGSSASNQFTLPATPTGTYNSIVSYGDGITNHITAWNQPEITHTYVTPGIYELTITGSWTGFSFSWNTPGDVLKILNISRWGSLRLGIDGLNFYGCSNLTITATDILDLTGTPLASNLFANCTALITIPNIQLWKWSNILDLSGAFLNCVNLTQDITGLDTQNVALMDNTLGGATSFNQNLGSWNVSSLEEADNFLTGVIISVANYDALLIGWAAQTVLPNGFLDAGSNQYSAAAVVARAVLTGAPNNWTINDGGLA